MNLLLAGSDAAMYAVIGVVGALLLICAIYGLIRKFTRLTWIGWELLIVFGVDLLLPKEMNFAVSTLLLVLCIVLPLAGEHFLRRALVTKQVTPSRGAANFFDHFGGMFTAIVGVLMFLAALGGLGVAVMGTFMKESSAVAQIPPILLEHGLDFFILAVCLVIARAGCRLGIMKGLNYLITVLLVFGAFFGCLLLFSQVGWGLSFSGTVGGWFGMKGSLAPIVGCGVLTLFFTLLLFIGIMFLSHFVDKKIRSANSYQAVAIPDGLILGIAYTAVFILLILGIQALFGALAQGDFLSSLVSSAGIEIDLGNVDSTLANIGNSLADFAKSSPISAGFYINNPFIG